MLIYIPQWAFKLAQSIYSRSIILPTYGKGIIECKQLIHVIYWISIHIFSYCISKSMVVFARLYNFYICFCYVNTKTNWVYEGNGSKDSILWTLLWNMAITQNYNASRLQSQRLMHDLIYLRSLVNWLWLECRYLIRIKLENVYHRLAFITFRMQHLHLEFILQERI